jgi:hypothetical protein
MPGAHDVQRVLGKPHAPVGFVLINDRLDRVDQQAFAGWSTLVWADVAISKRAFARTAPVRCQPYVKVLRPRSLKSPELDTKITTAPSGLVC